MMIDSLWAWSWKQARTCNNVSNINVKVGGRYVNIKGTNSVTCTVNRTTYVKRVMDQREVSLFNAENVDGFPRKN